MQRGITQNLLRPGQEVGASFARRLLQSTVDDPVCPPMWRMMMKRMAKRQPNLVMKITLAIKTTTMINRHTNVGRGTRVRVDDLAQGHGSNTWSPRQGRTIRCCCGPCLRCAPSHQVMLERLTESGCRRRMYSEHRALSVSAGRGQCQSRVDKRLSVSTLAQRIYMYYVSAPYVSFHLDPHVTTYRTCTPKK
jgi:hypothetical protein